eukprot:TRINITY_DN3946_c0_g1_i3.p1 TRINITY_DN3946_c0_g1~~TRINITY_DN3946_c0_g1_i3.p1  ORF type:complete len:982 (-),score=176.06 TRINITY_DN3946_c0_g1_i3:54-2999(-)
MRSVEGGAVAEQTVHEVRFLAQSRNVPWVLLAEGDGVKYMAYSAGAGAAAGGGGPRHDIHKAEAALCFPAEVVYEFVRSHNNLPNYDPCIKSATVAQVYDNDVCLALSECNPPPTVQLFADKSVNGVVFHPTRKECLLKCCHADAVTKTFVVAYRTVSNPAITDLQLVTAPSGWLIQGDTTGNQCLLVFISHMEVLDDIPREVVLKNFCASGRLFSGIRKWLESQVSPMRTPYAAAILLLEKEVCDSLLSISVSNGWRQLCVEAGAELLYNNEIYGKPVLAIKGVYKCNSSAEAVREFLTNHQTKWDLLSTSIDISPVDQIGSQVTQLLHKKFATMGSTNFGDTVILWVSKKDPDGVHSVLYRTVSSSEPESSLEFLSSGFFLHPMGPFTCLVNTVTLVSHASLCTTGPEDIASEVFRNAVSVMATLLIGMHNIIASSNYVIQGDRPKNAFESTWWEITEAVSHEWLSPGDSNSNSNKRKRPALSSSHSEVLLYPPRSNRPAFSFTVATHAPAKSRRGGGSARSNHRVELSGSEEDEKDGDVPAAAAGEQDDAGGTGCVADAEEDIEDCAAPPPPVAAAGAPSVGAFEDRVLSFNAPLGPNGGLSLENLPSSFVSLICQKLPLSTMLSLAMVSKRMYTLVNSQETWKPLYQQRFGQGAPRAMVCPNDDYRSAYVNEIRLWQKWKHKKAKVSVLAHGHTTTIRCLQYSPQTNCLFSGSSDRKVKLWRVNPETGSCTCQNTFSGPNAGVVGIDCDGQVLRVGYRNGGIWAWNTTPNSSSSFELLWHQQFVLLAEGFLFMPPKVILWEDAVNIWDETSAQIVQTFAGHTRRVTSVKVWQSVLISASLDKTIKLYDMKSGSAGAFSTMKGHTAGINCVELVGDQLLLSAGNDRSIKVWDLRQIEKGPLQLLSGHVSPVKCLKYAHQRVLSGSEDHSIRVWDAANGLIKPLQRFEEHVTPVTCLDFNERYLFSGSSDGVLKVWDFM